MCSRPTILITRPANRAAADMAVAECAGWQPLLFSPIAIAPDEAALQALPMQLAEADVVFWVSPSAVETATERVFLNNISALHIAVGRASVQALAQAGVVSLCPDDGEDSEAVWRLPVWQQLPRGARVLVVRGQGGREFLPKKLRQVGFAVEIAETYRRQPQTLDWRAFQTASPIAAYVTSSEIAQRLFQDVPPQLAQSLKTLLYFSHHARIIDTLRALGANNIIEARLSEAVLVNALRSRQK